MAVEEDMVSISTLLPPLIRRYPLPFNKFYPKNDKSYKGAPIYESQGLGLGLLY